MTRARPILDWLLSSAPLLLVLAAIAFLFNTEPEVVNYFAAHREANPELLQFFTFVTNFGNPFFYAIFLGMLIVAWRTGDRRTKRFVFVYIIVQLAVALVAVRFLKMTIGRPRPGEGMFFQPIENGGTHHSLPSGHTTEITGAAGALALFCGRWWLSLAMGVAIALVGFSRIYLGWHHPTDVFFGWLLGSVSMAAIYTFSRK
ncbi:phosphatase PAP2 family protein [Salidesulfovibrio brasiliensis]|uniref:phosphatase PAP2 family protein n=1 Tax=Salidesulfovibrio brasiliensis TaxID=221711 RepID=UPI0006D06998|nr:phosphatase PAP2 family protein [Salidesulfovibrio brasiliensis]